jgi:hypothetical protein
MKAKSKKSVAKSAKKPVKRNRSGRKSTNLNLKQIFIGLGVAVVAGFILYQYGQIVGLKPITTEEYAEKIRDCKTGEYTLETMGLSGTMEIPAGIEGIKDGVCVATMELPNNGLQTCKFPEADLNQVAQDYIDSVSGDTKVTATSSLEGSEVQSNNPLQKYLEDDTCQITGY